MEDQLIIKYLANECTSSEKAEFETWLNKDSQNKIHFLKIKKLWEHSERRTDNFNPDVHIALKRIHEKIESESFSKVVALKPDFFYYAKRVAAILIFGICISFAIYFNRELISANNMVEIKTEAERKELLLSDGTTVWMNKHSSIRFHEKFKDNMREIFMEGEAYFNVAKDPKKPFIIHANNSVTQVVGTSFNIRSPSDEDSILVTVTSGKVVLYEQSNKNQKIYLSKGDKGILVKSSHEISKIKNEDLNFLSWQTGKLVFNNTPMKETVNTLSLYYNKTIAIDGNLAHCRFTSTFDNQPLEEVLEELKMLLNAKIESKNSIITLTGQGCK